LAKGCASGLLGENHQGRKLLSPISHIAVKMRSTSNEIARNKATSSYYLSSNLLSISYYVASNKMPIRHQADVVILTIENQRIFAARVRRNPQSS
jgi:hypothetical protein